MSEMSAVQRTPLRHRSSTRATLGRVGWIAAAWLICAALAASTIYPLVFLTLTSFRTNNDYARDPGGLPRGWTLQHFREMFINQHIAHFALNSFVVVSIAVILLTVTSSLAAYALALSDFPLRRTVLVIVVAMMALPHGVLLIPIFRSVLDLGLVNKRLGLILVYTALNLPFSIYLLTSYMRAVPRELIQAAELDGAGPLGQLWSVVLPLIRPGLLALVTLNFLFLWNEFLFALVILQNEGVRTILVVVTGLQGGPGIAPDFGALSAGLLLSMIPPILIFALFQRDLVRGLTVGAVK